MEITHNFLAKLSRYTAVDWAEFLGAVGTTLAVYLMSEQIFLAGFITGSVANVFWIYFSLAKQAKCMAALNVLLTVFNFNGIYNVLN